MLRCSPLTALKGLHVRLAARHFVLPALIPFLIQTHAILLSSLCNKGSFSIHPLTSLHPMAHHGSPRTRGSPRNLCLIFSYTTECPVRAEPITLHSHKQTEPRSHHQLIISCIQHVIANNPSETKNKMHRKIKLWLSITTELTSQLVIQMLPSITSSPPIRSESTPTPLVGSDTTVSRSHHFSSSSM